LNIFNAKFFGANFFIFTKTQRIFALKSF